MKTTTKLTFLSALVAGLSLLDFTLPCHAIGIFEYAKPPTNAIGHIILMPDGTVLASQYDTNFSGTSWYRLTPDIHGSYVSGTWSNIAPANYDRYDFSSVVLKDGRLFVAGGEYGNGAGTTAEIYNPSNNTWTIVSPPSSLINSSDLSPNTGEHCSIADAECKVLPDGNVLIIPADPEVYDGTLIYNPATNGWSAGPPSLNFLGEATAMKLPDGSILTVDADDYSSERYLPASNIWTNDASTSPTSLWTPLGPNVVDETGPALLLPNGNAIFFGGIGETAIYTPSGSNSPGSWAPGAPIPGGNVAADSPGAMMFNGKILIDTSQEPYLTGPTTVVFPATNVFYEYDYTAPTNSAYTKIFTLNGAPSILSELVDLPDGTLLLSVAATTNLFIYQPDGSPLAAGKPAISSITVNGDGSYTLTGTLFNGISEGASYGDDQQMDSNFPLVRFIDASGNVRYGRTYNWSSTGVMTSNSVVSTQCMPPAGSSPQDTIEVVANGIASSGVVLDPIVTTLSDSGAGSLRLAVSESVSGSTITFAAGLTGQTVALTSGELPVNYSVTVDASALAGGIWINGNHNSRIFDVAGGTSVTLNSLTITNGWEGAANGGGIQNAGTLTLNNCTLAGNATDASNVAGAVYNLGNLTMTACTLAGNSADFAGAIQNDGNCTLVNCTLANNTAPGGNGGAIDNVGGTLAATQCTFSGNSAAYAGGGIDNYLGQVTLANTIVANDGSDNGSDVYNWSSSTIYFAGNNLVPGFVNAGGTAVQEGEIIILNPLLGPLANNGGPTLTMMPQSGSPAIDAGVNSYASGINYDQRGPGYPRIAGGVVDIGAVEVAVAPYVFNTADSGYGSLRYAATYAADGSTITFAPALAGQTITLLSGAITVNASYTIDGSSLSSPVQINGDQNSGIFSTVGGTVVLDSLILTNGYYYNASGSGGGGAILNEGATLSLNNCTLAGNSSGVSEYGGAILNVSPLSLTGCTLSGNIASYGGAIVNYGTTCSLVNCTVANNEASADAILNFGGLVTLTQCTVSGNSTGGGIDNDDAELILTNTIDAANGQDIYNEGGGVVDIEGVDIIQDLVNASGTVIGSGSTINANPLLGPLANNGGPTLTMAPQPGSPAINAGLTSAAAGITYDQRGPGYPRVVGSAVDIGAIEVQTIPATPPQLTGAGLNSGSFSFSFTNTSGATFTVFATTNLALPLSAWANLGPAVESPVGSGRFQFSDPQAGNSPQRFYEVQSP